VNKVQPVADSSAAGGSPEDMTHLLPQFSAHFWTLLNASGENPKVVQEHCGTTSKSYNPGRAAGTGKAHHDGQGKNG